MRLLLNTLVVLAVLSFVPSCASAQSIVKPPQAKPTKQQITTWILDFVRDNAVPRYDDNGVLFTTKVSNGNILYEASKSGATSMASISMSEMCAVNPVDIVSEQVNPYSLIVKLKNAQLVNAVDNKTGKTLTGYLDTLQLTVATAEQRERLLKAISDLCSYNCPKEASGLY